MKVNFQTKEESNKKQLDDFLKLSKAERFYQFLKLIEKVKKFPIKNKTKTNSNFFIEIKSS